MNLYKAAKASRHSLMLLDAASISSVLVQVAARAEANASYILAENQRDLNKMNDHDPKYDRLLLTEDRIKAIASDMRKVAEMPSPVGVESESFVHRNGMVITKRTVPFGVIGVIYEARPNVSFDVFALCFKSQNVCILKGSSDAQYSNAAIAQLIRTVLDENGINPDVCTLLDHHRSNTDNLLHARNEVDLIIPRGGKALINYVRENSKIPIIETGAGVCHTYFDEAGNVEKATPILLNAKTRRVSVCNSLDCLIVHHNRLCDLYSLCAPLEQKNVKLYADEASYNALKGHYKEALLFRADESDFGTEYLDYKMSIKTVACIEEALEHIEKYGSKHSESIISEDPQAIHLFENLVDAACVYANVSTAFTDGGEFGLGAEIGISTQKMHARGPMALRELCTYKWIIEGVGQTR